MSTEFEARYFLGESPGGSGLVCRGLRSLVGTLQQGNYVQCALEMAAQSPPISVIDSVESQARYDSGWGTLPGHEGWVEPPHFRSLEGGYIQSPGGQCTHPECVSPGTAQRL